jgi:hypothetical protein
MAAGTADSSALDHPGRTHQTAHLTLAAEIDLCGDRRWNGGELLQALLDIVPKSELPRLGAIDQIPREQLMYQGSKAVEPLGLVDPL